MAVDKKAMRDRERRRHPAVRAYYGWDNLGDVHATLTQLEHGDFSQAAIMTDAMFRDDRFYGVLRTRINALQSVPLDLKASSDKPKAIKIAEQLGGVDDGPSEWDRMYSPPVVGDLVKWGACLGAGIGENIWQTDSGAIWFPPDEPTYVTGADGTKQPVDAPKGVGLWKPRMRVWHPQFLRWDDMRQRYILRTYDYEVVLPDVHENPRSDGHWVMWFPYGYHGAWLQGLVRALAVTVLDRTWNKNDWSRYNETYGKAIKKAIVPAGATADQKSEHFEGIANLHGESTVMCSHGRTPEGEEANFDVEYAEPKSTGWDTFQARKKENDGDIAIVALGQAMTTEVVDGKGSLGVDPAQTVRRDYLKADAGVMVALRDQGLTWFTQINFGDPELAPRPEYRVDPPEDKVAAATSQSTTVQTIATARSAGISSIDERAMLDDANIPQRAQEEIDAEVAVAFDEAAAENEARDAAAADGADGAAPTGGVKLTPSAQAAIITVNEARAVSGLPPLDADGDMLISEYQARNEAEIAKEVAADAPAVDAPEPDEETKKKRQTFKAIAAFTRPLALAGKVPPTVVKRYHFAGLPIAVENERGSTRTWAGGSTRMQHDYGFIDNGQRAWDDDEVDVYVGPNEKAPMVHVVHQLAAPTYDRYDEDKVMLGFNTHEDAVRAYVAHRNDGAAAIKSVSTMSLKQFHRRLAARTGSGPIRATARHVPRVPRVETTRALMALAARVSTDVIKLRAMGGKGPAYADRLVTNATRLAARALAGDLVAVKQELAQSSGFADLEQRLLRRFKDMDPTKLAGIIEKVRIMGNLSGQLSARKELKK